MARGLRSCLETFAICDYSLCDLLPRYIRHVTRYNFEISFEPIDLPANFRFPDFPSIQTSFIFCFAWH